ncbi:MAG: hypothetical protein ACI8UO_001691 [Verrucomicrobiales bacterium]|jgi:hypothetical protein
MIRFLADENFNRRIFRALRLRSPDIDLVRVQDEGLTGADDPAVLDRAASENRILLSHDYKTIPGFACERIAAGLPMPGVFLADSYISISVAVEEISILAEFSEEGEWEGQVRYLPIV